MAAWTTTTTGFDPSSGFVQQTILWFDVCVPIINLITLSVVVYGRFCLMKHVYI